MKTSLKFTSNGKRNKGDVVVDNMHDSSKYKGTKPFLGNNFYWIVSPTIITSFQQTSKVDDVMHVLND